MRLAAPGPPTLSKFYRSAWWVIDLLYPPHCAGCGQPGVRWCQECRAAAKEIHQPVCPVCGQPQTGFSLCANCQTDAPRYTALRSCLFFSGVVRQAIHRLKYHRDLGAAEMLSEYLVRKYQTLDWPVDVVVPVPLSSAHLRQRGYNQAAFLALPFALRCSLPYQPSILRRSRSTASQVGLSISARRENVRGAFTARAPLTVGKKILLIDDVATTGATMDACAAALLHAGADSVYALTLAHALRREQLV